MKLLSLSLSAFGPFPGRHSIDFAAIDAGVYLISGPTGAGKSSILDAIVFALYGRIPREASATGAPFSVRSDLAQPETDTSIALEFETSDTVFRIERSPAYERPKLRGTGTARTTAKATLLALREGEWQVQANGAREVGVAIEEVVGLNRDQFQQIIVLAQGRFAEFLHADSSEREGILRKLFSSTRFQRLTERVHQHAGDGQRELNEIARAIDEAVERARARVEAAGLTQAGDQEAAEDARSRLQVMLELASEALAQANVTRTKAGGAHATASNRLRLAQQVETDRQLQAKTAQALSALEQRGQVIERYRERLAKHRKAEQVRPELVTAERARRETQRATEAVDACNPTAPLGELQHELDSLRNEGADVRSLVATEQSLPELETQASAAEAAATAAINTREQAAARFAEIPSQRRELIAIINDLSNKADRLPEAISHLERLQTAARLHGEREALGAKLSSLRSAAEAADDDLRGASDEVRRLLEQFFATTSARLARELKDGQACSVCGSTEHPSPATGSHDHLVDTEAIEQAQAGEADLRQIAEEARASLVQHETERRAIDEELKGVDSETLDAELSAAESAVRELESAKSQLQSSRDRLDDLDTEIEQQQASADELSTAAAKATAASDTAAERVSSAKRAIAAVLGEDHDETVAQRLHSIESATKRLNDTIEAMLSYERAAKAETEAVAALETALRQHDAGDEATAKSWLLESKEFDRLQTDIDEFTAERERLRGVLAQPSLQNLDARITAEGGDIAALTVAEADAKAAADEASEAAAAWRLLLGEIDRESANVEASESRRRALGDRAATLSRLAATLGGHDPNTRKMKLETYVLAAQLEMILEAANVRLESLTDSRFTLEHFDGRATRGAFSGLGIVVADAYSGTRRSVSSLSGGETFLASLALALGLADVVQASAGGTALETLFIDEGFGSLDQETLELAMQTLHDLHTSGRNIGVISHVTSMQERLPQLITVRPLPGGEGSTIEVADAS